MRRLLAIALLAMSALVLAAPGPKLVSVTNPLTSDLHGATYAIDGLSYLESAQVQADVVLLVGTEAPNPVRGTIVLGDHQSLTGVELVGGYEDPQASAFDLAPGTLYLRHTLAQTGELWIKLGSSPTSWSCIAGCTP